MKRCKGDDEQLQGLIRLFTCSSLQRCVNQFDSRSSLVFVLFESSLLIDFSILRMYVLSCTGAIVGTKLDKFNLSVKILKRIIH